MKTQIKSMPPIWALQDAKARLSELVRKVQQEGPQSISVHGKVAVVIISQKEYEALTVPSISLVDFFRKSPLVGVNIDFSRNK